MGKEGVKEEEGGEGGEVEGGKSEGVRGEGGSGTEWRKRGGLGVRRG